MLRDFEALKMRVALSLRRGVAQIGIGEDDPPVRFGSILVVEESPAARMSSRR